MQQPHIPTREQSDASLITFFAALGHRPPATLAFRASPRLSDRPVHADLPSTVARLRARTADPVTRNLAPRLIALRDAAEVKRDRIANRLAVAVLVVFAGWFAVPVALAAAAGAL